MDRAPKSKAVAKEEPKTATKAEPVAKTKTVAKTVTAGKTKVAAKTDAANIGHKTAPNKSGERSGNIKTYWTPERMRGATLHPALRPKRKKPAKAKIVPGIALKTAKPTMPAKRFAKSAADLWTYETTPVPDVRTYPASTIGKIYMTYGEKDYFVTGFVVGSRTVFTVASALYDRGSGQWASNVVFYPEYNHGPGAGLGPFWIDELWVAANWQEKGELLNDFGAIITSVPIQPFTGNVGLMANAPINQGQYLVLGYPGTPVPGYPFDGEQMWQSTSAYMGDFAWIIQAGGNMTYGAHGAPWLIFREGGWYANGIFAVQVVDPDSMLSPYFGNEVWDFYSYLKKLGYT